MEDARRLLWAVALLLPCLWSVSTAYAQEIVPDEDTVADVVSEKAELVPGLAPKYVQWLASVKPLISEEEREYFLSIQEDYRRDAFIDKFWEVRDPDPRTRFNELRFRWEEHLEQSAGLPSDDARSILFLLHGEPGRWLLPDGREVGRCYSRSDELEIWFYGGSELTTEWFAVLMLKRGAAVPYEFWYPGENLRAVNRGRLPTTNVRLLCADELGSYAIRQMHKDTGYVDFLDELTNPTSPSSEWLATFAAITTEVPPGSETFDVDLELDFPGRNQNRTAVQAVLAVPAAAAGVRDFDGELFHQFHLVGEVLRGERLFEVFRYRYELPYAESVERIPLLFTRYLRSGPTTFRIRVEDVFSGRFARLDSDFMVPSAEGRESVRPKPQSPVFRLLAEAAEAAARGERVLRLIPPPEGSIQVGMVRFETQAIGNFDRVTFYLDDQAILSKRRPPYSVELNLGSLPSTHRLRVVGTEDGREVATDEVRVNQGGQRFRVHITEPRSDRKYESSVAAMVQVDTPDEQKVDRVEIFLSEKRVATLYQAPYVQSLLLPDAGLTYIRAVAYLEDGSSSEDVVFVNAPDYLEEVEVQYVEIHALVVDGNGRPMLDLEQDRFTIREDGRVQEIRRFEWVSDLPVHAGLLIDTSASMADSLAEVREAALSFARTAIQERDRICFLSFASQPHIEVRFTSDVSKVEQALSGISAEGSTALYDSLVYALSYFDGVRGQKALLLLSDGQDENSTFDFKVALEVAQRSGVTVYTIGLKDSSREKASRKVLRQIAEETGGKSYFLDDLSRLEGIYAEIEEELRSRYLLAYQSTSTKEPSKFRVVSVEVDEKGADVRSMSGYYP